MRLYSLTEGEQMDNILPRRLLMEKVSGPANTTSNG